MEFSYRVLQAIATSGFNAWYGVPHEALFIVCRFLFPGNSFSVFIFDKYKTNPNIKIKCNVQLGMIPLTSVIIPFLYANNSIPSNPDWIIIILIKIALKANEFLSFLTKKTNIPTEINSIPTSDIQTFAGGLFIIPLLSNKTEGKNNATQPIVKAIHKPLTHTSSVYANQTSSKKKAKSTALYSLELDLSKTYIEGKDDFPNSGSINYIRQPLFILIPLSRNRRKNTIIREK